MSLSLRLLVVALAANCAAVVPLPGGAVTARRVSGLVSPRRQVAIPAASVGETSPVYRLRGGSGPLVSVAAYYAIGTLAYRYLEQWSMIDSIYFLTVTATTVGYGDIAPITHAGRIFTSVYSLVGITIAFSSIVRLVEFMRNGDFREHLLQTVANLPGLRRFLGGAFLSMDVDTNDPNLSVFDVNLRISYRRRYALCLLAPTILFGGITLVAGLVHKLPASVCAYFGVITMSTIGYGDLGPTTNLGKLCAVVYLPLGVTALADALADIAAISTRRKIREADYAAVADELLAREAVRHGRNPDETLTEAEFLAAALMSNDLVDRETLNAIRRQYRHVVRRALPAGEGVDAVEMPVLTPALVYDELRERGKVAPDMSFDEWREREWLPRVSQGDVLPLGSPIEVPRLRYVRAPDTQPGSPSRV